MSERLRIVVLTLVGGLPVMLSACTQLGRMPFLPAESEATTSTSKKTQVAIEGGAKLLDKGELNTLSTGDFIAQVEQVLSTGRNDAAQRLIIHYPDLALQVLRSATAKHAQHGGLREIARVYDEQCGLQANEGWQAAIAEKASNPQRYAAYEKARERFQDLMNKNDFAAAAALGLRQTLPSAPAAAVEMDACHLAGKALLMAGEFAQAAESFTHALAVGQKHTHQAVYVLLLASDTQRRLEAHDRANEIWKDAVELASQSLTGPQPITDPVLWERCSYYRPYPNPWPAAVSHGVQQFLTKGNWLAAEAPRAGAQDRSDFGEFAVWACIGCCHLERNEPQAALLGLKRAEAATKSTRHRDQLQLIQAEAFARMGQPIAAMALLVQLAGRASPDISAPALAFIGSIKLKEGSVQQALGILRQAIEKHPTVQWPRRGEAEANLGLAFLMAGREEEGIRWLHSAQHRFAEANDLAHLRQCLTNEASYWDNVGKPDRAEVVRARCEETALPTNAAGAEAVP